MESIERSVVKNAQLTIYIAKGTVSREKIKTAISDFYQHGPVTRNVLWDVSQAVLTDLSAEDVHQISQVPRKFLKLRKGGKTAIVATSDLAFGLSRMYQASSQLEELPFEVQVFRDSETAHEWLKKITPSEKQESAG